MAQSGVSVAESDGHPGRQGRGRSPRCGRDSSLPARRACHARCVWRRLAGRTLSADEHRSQRYERGCQCARGRRYSHARFRSRRPPSEYCRDDRHGQSSLRAPEGWPQRGGGPCVVAIGSSRQARVAAFTSDTSRLSLDSAAFRREPWLKLASCRRPVSAKQRRRALTVSVALQNVMRAASARIIALYAGNAQPSFTSSSYLCATLL